MRRNVSVGWCMLLPHQSNGARLPATTNGLDAYFTTYYFPVVVALLLLVCPHISPVYSQVIHRASVAI